MALGILARGVVTLFLLAVAVWACLEAAPGDPAERAARVAGALPADDGRLPPALRTRIVDDSAAQLGVARTPAGRLGDLLADLPGGTLRAWRDGLPVRAHLGRTLPRTLALTALALGWVALLGLGGALWAAGRVGRVPDAAVRVASALALALPVAWVCVLALRAFAWGRPWRWLPGSGGWLLPSLCLSLAAAALVARHGRQALLAALAQPFSQAARARGASPRRVLLVHGLATAAPLLLGILPSLLLALLGAVPVIEKAFDIDGAGALLLDAALRGDAPLVAGVTLCFGALAIACSAACALLAPRLDPRCAETT